MAKFKPKFREKGEPKGEERKESRMPPKARKRMEMQEGPHMGGMPFACGGKVKKR